MGMRILRLKTWMMDNAYLVTMGCLMAIVVCCAVYTQELRNAQPEGIQAAAEAPEIQEGMTPAVTAVTTPLPTIAPLAIRTTTLVERRGAWPVQGAVIRAYDQQEMVCWPSLNVWRTHAGLDIAGEEGEPVSVCLDGKVIHAAWDELWGWRVRISHEGGRETIYAGLESCIVGIGEQVRRGQTIGTLLRRIPCEAELGAHVHLEMVHGGSTQDPEVMLADR